MFWSCEHRKRLAVAESKRATEIEKQILDEETKYPELVHVIGDFILEGTQQKGWNDIWYVSSHYKHHFCSSRRSFKAINYGFKMVEKEETEKKFIFSYGIGSVAIDVGKEEITIRNVQYAPEVSLNILSFDLLEEQGFMVKVENETCTIKYMYDEGKVANECERCTNDLDDTWEQRRMVTDHNKYLDDYFESLDPKEEEELVKGLEDLNCDNEIPHDYIDDDYLSHNGTLYAMKVNSFSRFLSFMKLVKNDGIVYRNWEVFTRKFIDMVKWFYMVHLNYDHLDEVPPVVGVMKIDLLALHKIVEGMDGYVAVTLSGKWGKVAQMLGLTIEDGDIIKGCFQKFVDMIVVYYDTAQIQWTTEKHKFEEGECSWTAQRHQEGGLDGWDEHTQQANRLDTEKGKQIATSSDGSNGFDVLV